MGIDATLAGFEDQAMVFRQRRFDKAEYLGRVLIAYRRAGNIDALRKAYEAIPSLPAPEKLPCRLLRR